LIVAIEFLCRKIGMTRLFSDAGECIPVTVLEAGPNTVVQKKTEEKDGYAALSVTAEIFEAGQKVDVIGTSKGRGTAGVVKRHNYKVKKKTHGTHEAFRHPGSIGAGAYPGKVFKGMGMFGRMGNARVTVRNLEVVRVDVERNLLMIRGAVPGHNNGLVRVRNAVAAH
jgi:large subunit ribosomal protein L3